MPFWTFTVNTIIFFHRSFYTTLVTSALTQTQICSCHFTSFHNKHINNNTNNTNDTNNTNNTNNTTTTTTNNNNIV